MCVPLCATATSIVAMTTVTCDVNGAVNAEVREALSTAPMTLHHDTLGTLRDEWQRAGRTPEARRRAETFRLDHPELALAGVSDLGDLVRVLEPRGGRTIEERAAICTALLSDAADPLIHRTLLQTLLPGVVSVCRQLHFGRGVLGDPSQMVDEALSIATELLSEWAGQSRQYAAPDILSALRGRLRRWLLKEKSLRRSFVGNYNFETPATETSPLLSRLAALSDGETARLAQLTYARVFEGRALRDLAVLDRTAPKALAVELQQFAMKHLI